MAKWHAARFHNSITHHADRAKIASVAIVLIQPATNRDSLVSSASSLPPISDHCAIHNIEARKEHGHALSAAREVLLSTAAKNAAEMGVLVVLSIQPSCSVRGAVAVFVELQLQLSAYMSHSGRSPAALHRRSMGVVEGRYEK